MPVLRSWICSVVLLGNFTRRLCYVLARYSQCPINIGLTRCRINYISAVLGAISLPELEDVSQLRPRGDSPKRLCETSLAS